MIQKPTSKNRQKSPRLVLVAVLAGLVCLSAAAWPQTSNGSGPTKTEAHATTLENKEDPNPKDPAVQAVFAVDAILKMGMTPSDLLMAQIDQADAAGRLVWENDRVRRYLATWRRSRQVIQHVDQAPWQHGPSIVQLTPTISLPLPAGFKYLDPKGVADLRQQIGVRTMAGKEPSLARAEEEDRAKHAATDPSAGDLSIHEHLLMPEDEHWGAQLFTARTGHVAIMPLDGHQLLKTVRLRLNPLSSGTSDMSKLNAYSEDKVRWIHAPDYDPATHSLVWGHTNGLTSPNTGLLSEQALGSVVILGRTQTVTASLIKGSPKATAAALDQLRTLMIGISFAEGQRYQDYRDGDLKAHIDLADFVTGPETRAEVSIRHMLKEQSERTSFLHFLRNRPHYIAIVLGLILLLLNNRKKDSGKGGE